ncbi:MAG: hypothetical protein H0X17_08625 [Deltaproteobacteria bacterium]|nr:hypothetical protein [Deltaproteobacteria bacterium]
MSRLSLFTLVLSIGCGGDDPPGEAWQLLTDAEPAALLSVWGTDAEDVWVTGGRSELAGAPTLLHLEAGTWSRVDSGQTGIDLWWAFGVPGSTTVYLGGSGGTILRSVAGGRFEKMITPRADGIVFGIWGVADDDLWAVGDGGNAGAIVWRYDGTSWTAVTLPANVPSRVFKVNGQASDDVWISCSDGVILRWQGTSIERTTAGVPAPLFSIVTTPSVTVAVGGSAGDGAIVEHDGTGWTRVSLASPVAWRGAAARGDVVFAVGEDGIVGTRAGGGWSVVTQPVTQGDFHAAWVDPDGGLWGVGGDFQRAPLTAEGFLTYFGTSSPEEVSR